MGSAHTNEYLQSNTRVPYAHRMALISDAMYEVVIYM
jgi:hypothetical protein